MSAQRTPAAEPAGDRTEVVVCGLDGSDGCVELARIAHDLAVGVGGRVELVHVLDGLPRASAWAMLDALCQSSHGAATARLVDLGPPAAGIAAAADSVRASLIVVAAGRVAGELAAVARCPILVLPRAIQQQA